MRDWKSTLGVILVFLLGGLAGAFLALTLAHHRVTTLLQRGSPAYEQLLERRLSHGLHLNDDQRVRFHDALMANIEQRKKLQLQIQPQVQELNAATRQEIRGILTLDQLVVLRRNMQDFRKRFGPALGGKSMDAETDSPTNNYGATNAPPQ